MGRPALSRPRISTQEPICRCLAPGTPGQRSLQPAAFDVLRAERSAVVPQQLDLHFGRRGIEGRAQRRVICVGLVAVGVVPLMYEEPQARPGLIVASTSGDKCRQLLERHRLLSRLHTSRSRMSRGWICESISPGSTKRPPSFSCRVCGPARRCAPVAEPAKEILPPRIAGVTAWNRFPREDHAIAGWARGGAAAQRVMPPACRSCP